MKHYITVCLVCLLSSSGLDYAWGQFICPPCDMFCDTLTFKQGGICPHCNMELIPQKKDFKISSDTILNLLQSEQTSLEVMQTVSHISDVFGSRLMGTKSYFDALRWSQKQLRDYDLDSVYMHDFDSAYRGWELQGFSMEMLEPSYAPLHAYPIAYTSFTDGEVVGEVIYLNNLDSVYNLQGKLKGKILLLGDNYRQVSSYISPMSRKFSDEELQQAQKNPDPNHRVIGHLARRSINQAIDSQYARRGRLISFFEFVKREGVLALIEASDFHYGVLHVDGNNHFPSYMKTWNINPISSFVLSNEHFGRLKRLIDKGFSPKLKLSLKAKYIQNKEYNQNLIGIIEGTDSLLKEEYVMIGAHFDSWHGGTGAVDNAAGAAVMMEAMRLIKKLNLSIKRSIAITLWGGEEQVFSGSLGYTEDKIGDIYTGEIKPFSDKISTYLNFDHGSGKIRGIYTMGNKQVVPIFDSLFKEFPESKTVTTQYTNQTDHELFDRLNIPAFQFIQDPLDYMTAIHHTNIDVYEYVDEDATEYNAILVAYLAYRLANLEEKLPRKSHNSPKPSREGNTMFTLEGFEDAKNVRLIGTFNNWNLFGTPLYKTKTGWECKIDLKEGEYLYKFYIDGDFVADPKTPKEKLKEDGEGHSGLTLLKISE